MQNGKKRQLCDQYDHNTCVLIWHCQKLIIVKQKFLEKLIYTLVVFLTYIYNIKPHICILFFLQRKSLLMFSKTVNIFLTD